MANKIRTATVTQNLLDASSVRTGIEPVMSTHPEVMAAAMTGGAFGLIVGAAVGRGKDAGAILAGGTAGAVIAALVANNESAGTLALTVRQGWDLTQQGFSRLIGYAPRTIAGFESGATMGAVPLRRYTEVRRLREALSQVMRPDYVSAWLSSPNPAYDGSSPIQVIERGEIDRVWASVHDLDSGMS